MSFIGTFGMFTTVRLGIYTSQQGLNLTGNNISNINTVGYTRQTLDIKSMNATGVDRYMDSNVRIGSGAIAAGISQMRDPYLDIRYRTECASVGYMDTKLSNLNDLAAIIDEVGRGDDENGIISAQLSDLLASLERLTEYTGQGEFDTQVRSSAASLVSLFNSYASKLETVENLGIDRFNQDVIAVNEILTNIQNLNSNIRKGDIHGVPGLEMRDERNRLLDKLSQYINIDVVYGTEEIAAGIEIEKLTIKLADTFEPNAIKLVDGIYAVQLLHDKTMPLINPDYNPADPNSLPYMKATENTDPNTNTEFPYLDAAGNPVATAEEAELTFVQNVEDATQVPNTNYNLTLSRLMDSKGNIQTKYTSVTPPTDIATIANPPADLNTYLTTLSGDPAMDKISWISDEAKDGTQTEYVLRKVSDGNNPPSYTYELSSATKVNSVEVALGDTALYGSLQAAREFLTESGEFATEGYINLVDPNAASKRGVQYYQKALDLLANKFAAKMNEANSGYLYRDHMVNGVVVDSYYVDSQGNYILDDQGNELSKNTTDIDALPAHIRSQLVSPENAGVLFSNRGDNNDPTGITASNIAISVKWASGDVKIVNSYEVIPNTNPPEVGTTDNTNILHMVSLMNQDMDYAPSELVPNAKKDTMFTGSFGEMLGNINAVLGNDQNSTQIMLDNYYMSAVELDTSRDSVSSVDLNDETVNMIQYQKSYSAACRLMTTMDEILDKLINGTGVAGR